MYSKERQQLKNSFDAMAPDLFETIRQSSYREVESEQELFSELNRIEKEKNRTSRPIAFGSMAVVAACLLCLVLFGKQENVRNRIIFDINPSISIWVDDKNQVTEVEALNEDGKEILDEFPELKNLDETVTEILERLSAKEYLKQNKASVLVTYAYEKGEVPQERVKKIVDNYLETENEQVTVIYQEIKAEEEEEKKAKEQGVSVGKYHFLQKLQKDHDLKADDLYDKNMDEIVKNANEKGVDLQKEGIAGSKKADSKEQVETEGSVKEEIKQEEEPASEESKAEKPKTVETDQTQEEEDIKVGGGDPGKNEDANEETKEQENENTPIRNPKNEKVQTTPKENFQQGNKGNFNRNKNVGKKNGNRAVGKETSEREREVKRTVEATEEGLEKSSSR